MAAQLNGPRRTFVYITDSSINRNISLDENIGIALGNTPSTNSSFVELRATGKRPIEPRYVILALKSNPETTRKAIICDYTNPIYLSSLATEVTIGGGVWVVTARVGEKRFTLKVDDAPPP